MNKKYRIFISYSHRDKRIRERLVAHLDKSGLEPIWDATFPVGGIIVDQVTSKIAYAHALIAIITPKSINSCWTQQEIGYAYGCGVPVLCVAIGGTPGGIAAGRLWLTLPKSAKNLEQKLDADDIRALIEKNQSSTRPTFMCAHSTSDRTKRLVNYARAAREFAGGHGVKIRYAGAFTSFSIPDKPTIHKQWRIRDSGVSVRSAEDRKRLWDEREVLEENARSAGCDLVIDPYIDSIGLTHKGKLSRLEILHEFVRRMPDNGVRLVVKHNQTDGNLVIVGNWFYAESVSPCPHLGFKQTIFTQHAGSVLAKIQEFDRDFAAFYHHEGGTKTDQEDALKKLEKAIRNIRAEQEGFRRTKGSTRIANPLRARKR